MPQFVSLAHLFCFYFSAKKSIEVQGRLFPSFTVPESKLSTLRSIKMPNISLERLDSTSPDIANLISVQKLDSRDSNV